MTKENFINKWAYVYNVKNPYFIADLEAVIATEIEKAQEAKPKELKWNCSTFDMSRLVEQEYKHTEQPEPKYPIGGYAPGHYTCICANCKIEFMGDKRAVQCEPCAVKTTSQPTEQPAQPSSQAKLDNSFDKDRFEAMFRAVVASGRYEIKTTEQLLAKLDAYYASKEKGGNNE